MSLLTELSVEVVLLILEYLPFDSLQALTLTSGYFYTILRNQPEAIQHYIVEGMLSEIKVEQLQVLLKLPHNFGRNRTALVHRTAKLGKAQAKYIFAFKSILDSGIRVRQVPLIVEYDNLWLTDYLQLYRSGWILQEARCQEVQSAEVLEFLQRSIDLERDCHSQLAPTWTSSLSLEQAISLGTLIKDDFWITMAIFHDSLRIASHKFGTRIECNYVTYAYARMLLISSKLSKGKRIYHELWKQRDKFIRLPASFYEYCEVK